MGVTLSIQVSGSPFIARKYTYVISYTVNNLYIQ